MHQLAQPPGPSAQQAPGVGAGGDPQPFGTERSARRQRNTIGIAGGGQAASFVAGVEDDFGQLVGGGDKAEQQTYAAASRRHGGTGSRLRGSFGGLDDSYPLAAQAVAVGQVHQAIAFAVRRRERAVADAADAGWGPALPAVLVKAPIGDRAGQVKVFYQQDVQAVQGDRPVALVGDFQPRLPAHRRGLSNSSPGAGRRRGG